MPKNRREKQKPGCLYFSGVALVGLATVVGLLFLLYRPDRPVANIVPASSSGPTFVVQVIRPRLGLPLGGLLPPRLFGLDSHLGFDSKSEGATVHRVASGRIQLGANDWDLLLLFDDEGRVASGTEVVFDLVFEDRVRRVRCRPGNPATGEVKTVVLNEAGEISGSFDIELAHCEDAKTGKPLGWPPKPFILHGSFDRFAIDSDNNRQRPGAMEQGR